MRRVSHLYLILTILSGFFVSPACAQPSDKNIVARTAEIDGVTLHYLTAGKGPAVILLHGYAETSRMWRPIIPVLAQKFTVIARDLPGIGESSIPPDKIDMIQFSGTDSRLGAFVRRGESTSGRSRYWSDGGVRVRHEISGGDREAGGDGCISSRRARMGGDL